MASRPRTMLMFALSPVFPPLLLLILIEYMLEFEVVKPPEPPPYNAAYDARLQAERRAVGLIP